MTEKEARLDEISRYERHLQENGVTNTVLLGFATQRRTSLDADFPDNKATSGRLAADKAEADRLAAEQRSNDAKTKEDTKSASR
jgi:hypothetical protein